MAKISKWKKFKRVFKRKLLKPLTYAVCASFVLYLTLSNIIIQKRITDPHKPHFIITRLSHEFDSTEFMHMLLTTQEIRDLPKEGQELIDFINTPTPSICPQTLEQRLKQMNWAPEAFHCRMQKFFKMNEVYERLTRLEETISFLSQELDENRLPKEMWSQIEILRTERDNIINKELGPVEYEFMKQYSGIAIRLQKQKQAIR